jgi:hypothetical protein
MGAALWQFGKLQLIQVIECNQPQSKYVLNPESLGRKK